MSPKIVLNAPAKLMKVEGIGANCAYEHDEPEGSSGQNYWPEALRRQTLYRPVDRGFEKDLRARLNHWANHRKQRSDPD
jgi:putative ATPase